MIGWLVAGARYAVTYIESLDYFLLDMKHSCLVRYRSLTADRCDSTGNTSNSCSSQHAAGEASAVVRLDCAGASLSWIVIQVAFAILTNNTTVFVVTEHSLKKLLSQSIANLETEEGSKTCIPVTFVVHEEEEEERGGAVQVFNFRYTPLHRHACTGHILVPSILPSLDQLLAKEVQTLSYLQEKYSRNHHSYAHDDTHTEILSPRDRDRQRYCLIDELMDEFDLLGDEERNCFVAERSAYLLARAKACSTFYSRTLASTSTLSEAPVISGQTLLEVHETL